jgi:hypothetical protein
VQAGARQLKVLTSTVADVVLLGPDSPAFEGAIAAILGRAPRELLRPALPFSVIVENRTSRAIALLGVRFDLLGARGKLCSVVHYSDTLRNPQKGDFLPGSRRFVCAEPEYTALVRSSTSVPRTRGRMNLDNLRRMLSIAASLDCVAFDDGQFLGPDSQGALERFARERETEMVLNGEALAREGQPPIEIENWLSAAAQDDRERARRSVAKKLLEALDTGGPAAMAERARAHRYRIALWRQA